MKPAAWEDLQGLVWRFAGASFGPDLAALILADAWGLFVFLRRLAGGVADVG